MYMSEEEPKRHFQSKTKEFMEECEYKAEKFDLMLDDLVREHGYNDCPVCKESHENSTPWGFGLSIASQVSINVICNACGVTYCPFVRAFKILMKEIQEWGGV